MAGGSLGLCDSSYSTIRQPSILRGIETGSFHSPPIRLL